MKSFLDGNRDPKIALPPAIPKEELKDANIYCIVLDVVSIGILMKSL